MRYKPKEKKNLSIPHLWFAWHPVKTKCGTWVWLEKVKRRFCNSRGEYVGRYSIIEYYLHDGTWYVLDNFTKENI